MQGVKGRAALMVLALVLTASCASKNPQLLNLKADTDGPDEFLIQPNKPLQEPEDYTALPDPTPGGKNLADPTPFADAAEALGGKGERTERSGLYAGEQALVNHASRYGRSAGIRDVLAAEDLEWRRKHDGRLLERLFNVNVYFKAYRVMSLDQYLELERFRRAGVWTPAVPPDGAGG